jgi:histone deacetylase 11
MSITKLLHSHVTKKTLPIFYNDSANMGFWGLENLHPFDVKKYQKIHTNLKAETSLTDASFVKAKVCTDDFLRTIHTPKYVSSFNQSRTVAQICEFPAFAYTPNFILHRAVINPMKIHVNNTRCAGEFALKYGWSICLSSGMHHASSDAGGGWCPFTDIPLSACDLLKQKKIKNVMVIDLDAHQGNGIGRDRLGGFMGDNVYIMDMYSSGNYPHDTYAKGGIDKDIGLGNVSDNEYLLRLGQGLTESFNEFGTSMLDKPDIVYYNAGSDILKGDPLGHMSVSSKGLILRDEMVFRKCLENNVPIVMTLSGGYQKTNARVITDSIKNLLTKFGLIYGAEQKYEQNVRDDLNFVQPQRQGKLHGKPFGKVFLK